MRRLSIILTAGLVFALLAAPTASARDYTTLWVGSRTFYVTTAYSAWEETNGMSGLQEVSVLGRAPDRRLDDQDFRVCSASNPDAALSFCLESKEGAGQSFLVYGPAVILENGPVCVVGSICPLEAPRPAQLRGGYDTYTLPEVTLDLRAGWLCPFTNCEYEAATP